MHGMQLKPGLSALRTVLVEMNEGAIDLALSTRNNTENHKLARCELAITTVLLYGERVEREVVWENLIRSTMKQPPKKETFFRTWQRIYEIMGRDEHSSHCSLW